MNEAWVCCPYQRYFARSRNEEVPDNWRSLVDMKYKFFQEPKEKIRITVFDTKRQSLPELPITSQKPKMKLAIDTDIQEL
ncbi:unnamed protein product [Kuraishia capsulata CBS 1993]|uniref:Uncharacterized protein n=1 Tax=Kuraishia capsulata CBS 1993 TaxID=1382522 RepID=W6MID6_9ASCO|nr:uncharacterized protein KUCA_T00000067001 [Kuraishia capsulata CBS 1993]CDK24107.1 unnamed protein product [Kuraishia capsulata CBS 1993]